MLYKTDRGEPKFGAIVGTAIGVIVLIILIFSSTGTIKAGQKGVYLRNNGITGRLVDEGRYYKLPFFDSVVPLSIQVNKFEEVMSCGASSSQGLIADITVNYQVDGSQATKVYRDFGNDVQTVQDKLVKNNLEQSVKAVTIQYDATVVLSKRDEIAEKATQSLRDKMAPYGILVNGISISDLDFLKEYKDALELKAKADIVRQTASIQYETAKVDAQTKIEAAKGEAEAIKITTQSLTEQPQYLELKRIEALQTSAEKGVKIVPDTILGAGANTLYTVGK